MNHIVQPALVAASVFACTVTAPAHVDLLAPDTGEVLTVGTTFTVTWEVAVQHDLQDWDLWYAHEGPEGPWIEVATDLPPGDGAAGTIHTHAWTIPNEPDDTVWVRVRQDNGKVDYEDVSAIPSVILGGCASDVDGDGTTGFTDLLEVLSQWGQCDDPACDPADVNDDGAVDFNDLLILLSNWGPCSP